MFFSGTEYVFTDGAALANGYINCTAAWAVFFDDNDPRNCASTIVEGPVSNQVAELTAVSVALDLARSVDHPIVIVTDSKYTVDCLTKWYKQWERNNWKTQKGDSVKHRELIQKCRALLKTGGENITFLHVNSHQKRPKGLRNTYQFQLWHGNNQADRLASEQVNKRGVSVTW